MLPACSNISKVYWDPSFSDNLRNIRYYGIPSSGGSCPTIGTSTKCFGGSGGGIRGTGNNGGGDGMYIDFYTSAISETNMNGKTGTGGGGGSGNTPGTGGSGTVILQYLSSAECPVDLPYYNWSLISPICTTCFLSNPSTPVFNSATGLCGSCPSATPNYNPVTKTCGSSCPSPLFPNPAFSNVCSVLPLTCQGARPYFNGYECTGSQVNFTTPNSAKGGTSVKNIGQYIVHIFTRSDTFIPPISGLTGDVLIVGGGGGGGTYSIEDFVNPRSSGGGGGGEVIYLSNFSFGQQSWVVTVGQGGTPNRNGGDSSFGTRVAKGGGAGSSWPEIVNAQSGGSGGGASGQGYMGLSTGTGFAGGLGTFTSRIQSSGGGGGGMVEPGIKGGVETGGKGGDGVSYDISGTNVYYGGGGGGSAVTLATINGVTYVTGGIGGQGGLGGGGYGAGSVVYNETGYQKTNMVRGENGIPGTGGGGGGGASVASRGNGQYQGNPVTTPGSTGGSGIVIVRYLSSLFCPPDLPNFNNGLKTCTKCPSATPVFNTSTNQCEACPSIQRFWNGISCVTQCPSVLPRADSNNICQLPCSPASPAWDGDQCVVTCPETKPILTAGNICDVCKSPTPFWDTVTKQCVARCSEFTDTGNVCRPCYIKTPSTPYWDGAQCTVCPALRPNWTGPINGCQQCPIENPVFYGRTCMSCEQYDSKKPFYNQTPDGPTSSSVLRCQPCPVTTPSWDIINKTCKQCEYPNAYWDVLQNNCTVCPVSTPYWNTRVCARPTNILNIPMTATTTSGVTASATSSTTPPWQAFDQNTTTIWTSLAGVYSSGLYTGKAQIRDNLSGNLFQGEMLQIELQESYIISSYLLRSSNAQRWAVLGSSDGLLWELIDDKTPSDRNPSAGVTYYITPPISNAYPVYRLVVTKSSSTSVSVSEWTLQTASNVVTSNITERSAFTVISGIIEGCNSMSCVLDKAESADITDLVYGNYPPIQVSPSVLPNTAQKVLSNCSSNIDCNFVQFDFISNAYTVKTRTPYLVSTAQTTTNDVGVFQKKYGATPPPKFNAPPGLVFNSLYLTGTKTGTDMFGNIDQCGKICTNNLSCKGFNFFHANSRCEFYSTTTLSDTWATDRVSFIRDQHIKTQEQNPVRLSITNLNSTTCETATACNSDITTLVNELGVSVQSFSTSEIESCEYCPIRSVARQGPTDFKVTVEGNTTVTTTTTSGVMSIMRLPTYSEVEEASHVNLMSRTTWRIRPYAQFSFYGGETVSITNKFTQTNVFGQIWMGTRPFAAGIAPRTCLYVCFGTGCSDSRLTGFFPLYAYNVKHYDSETNQLCYTTEQGTHTYTDGTRTKTVSNSIRGGGNPDLLVWEFIPVDWVTNGYYIRARGTDKRITSPGDTNFVSYDAVSMDLSWKPSGTVARPYLKWGSYIGKYTDFDESHQTTDEFINFWQGFAETLTEGLYQNPGTPERDTQHEVYFDSFPPQFQTMNYPNDTIYKDLQILPSQATGSKFDDVDYIFVLDPV